MMESAPSVNQGYSSHRNSPVPRQQLSVLSTNQRSYSRLSSSKGMAYDDDSLTLLSPLPLYPRRRSVRFASNGKTTRQASSQANDDSAIEREERPYYTMYTHASQSVPVSPARDRAVSPTPVSILKSHSSYGGVAETGGISPDHEAAALGGNAGSRANQPAAAAVVTHGHNNSNSNNFSPTTFRARSSSRQRLAARRREAQMHYSFYDDSFVEDFVLSARAQIEQQAEDEARQRDEAELEAMRDAAAQEQQQQQSTFVNDGMRDTTDSHVKRDANVNATDAAAAATTTASKEADPLMAAADDGLNAIQRVKNALLAAAQRRRSSVTPPPLSRYQPPCNNSSSRNHNVDVDPQQKQRQPHRHRTTLTPSSRRDETNEAVQRTHKSGAGRPRVYIRDVEAVPARRRFSAAQQAAGGAESSNTDDEAVLRAAMRELLALPSSSCTNKEGAQHQPRRRSRSSHYYDINHSNSTNHIGTVNASWNSTSDGATPNDDAALSDSALLVQQPKQRQLRQQRNGLHRRPSEPLVSEDAMSTGVAYEQDAKERENSRESGDAEYLHHMQSDPQRRAKLQRILARLLARRGSHTSRRSVVVIDWSNEDDDEEDADTNNANENGTETRNSEMAFERTAEDGMGGSESDVEHAAVPLRRRRVSDRTAADVTRAAVNRSSSVTTRTKRVRLDDDDNARSSDDDDTNGSGDSARLALGHQGNERSKTCLSATRPSRSRSMRSTSAQGTSSSATLLQPPPKPTRELSAMPELTESMIMEESSRPILLPRRHHRRPEITRSISQLRVADENDNDSEEAHSGVGNRADDRDGSSVGRGTCDRRLGFGTRRRATVDSAMNRGNNSDALVNMYAGNGRSRVSITGNTSTRATNAASRKKITMSDNCTRDNAQRKVHYSDVVLGEDEREGAMYAPSSSTAHARHGDYDAETNDDSLFDTNRSKRGLFGAVGSRSYNKTNTCYVTNDRPGYANYATHQTESVSRQRGRSAGASAESTATATAITTTTTARASPFNATRERGRSGTLFGANRAAPSAAVASTAIPSSSSESMPSDDPMAVFFQAAFPSPSKFDAILRSAGGLVETSHNVGGRGCRRRMMHQPNLVLPASIVRQR